MADKKAIIGRIKTVIDMTDSKEVIALAKILIDYVKTQPEPDDATMGFTASSGRKNVEP